MKHSTRRTFLQTMSLGAGAALFNPFLRSVVAAETPNNIPKRYVFVIEGNGIEPISMLSKKAQTALETSAGKTIADNWGQRWFYNMYTHTNAPLIIDNMDFETTLSLGGVVGKTNEVSLVENAAVVLGLSSKVTGGGHSTHHGALSCTRSGVSSPGGQTIDAYLAALSAVRKDAPFDAVRLGISSKLNRRLGFDTCAYGFKRPAPIILHPAAAYNSLFGSVGSKMAKATFLERANLLDFAQSDVKALLKAFTGGSLERAKLEKYLASLEKLSKRQQLLIDLEADSKSLSKHMPEDPATNPLYKPHKSPLFLYSDPFDGLRAQFELASAALLGGLTNVAVIAVGGGKDHFDITYPSIPETEGLSRHTLHHMSGANAGYQAAIHEATRLQVDMVCALARDLATTPEPGADGTMLDHTIIVYMSDNGEQHHSKASDWPMLVLGGKKLGLKLGGRTIIYPTLGYTGHRQVSNVFNTLGHTAGQNLNTFGKEGPMLIKPGPLSELYG